MEGVSSDNKMLTHKKAKRRRSFIVDYLLLFNEQRSCLLARLTSW